MMYIILLYILESYMGCLKSGVKSMSCMQGTRVQSLVWKIPYAMGQQSPWATTTEQVLWSPRAITTESTSGNY